MEPIIQARVEQLISGEPTFFGGLTVVPLTAGSDQLSAGYLTLDRALADGSARVTEVSAEGRVPELLFSNDGAKPVLLLDGEALVGAKQNRVVNLTILAPANRAIRIPVSCVEQGRWRASSSQCVAAPRTIFSRARAAKADHVTTSLFRDRTAQSDQGSIWDHIQSKCEALGTSSGTSAMADVYQSNEARLAEYLNAFPVVPGQVGALIALGDRIGLELFDCPVAFAALFPKVIRGYALDAIEGPREACVDGEMLSRFLRKVGMARGRDFAVVGLGRAVRFCGRGVSGGALVHDGRVVHLAAFGKVRRHGGEGRGTRGGGSGRAARRMRILFFDDDPHRHRRFAADARGHEVHHAWFIDEAQRLLASNRYDLVCLDHDLETEGFVRNGLEVARFVRRLPGERRPKAVLIHSWNPQGAAQMHEALRSVYRPGVTLFKEEFGTFRVAEVLGHRASGPTDHYRSLHDLSPEDFYGSRSID